MTVNLGWPEFIYPEGDDAVCVRLRHVPGTERVILAVKGAETMWLRPDDLDHLAQRLKAWAAAVRELRG